MMPNLTNLISSILSLPDDALIYEVSRRLHNEFPGKFILETDDYDFDLAAYAAAGKCMIHMLDSTFGHYEAEWAVRGAETSLKPVNGLFEIHWRGKVLLCVIIGRCALSRHYIISDSGDDAMEFFRAVCDLEVNVEGEILVFSNGFWQRDKELMSQIKSADLASVVLPDQLKQDLLGDIEGFFAARELYEKHNLPWKRGLLLLGDPGNGKTMTIKALVKRLGLPCLYVRSFCSEVFSVHRSIGRVFAKAREVAPCVIVLEDIDSLVEQDDVSFLLNELDGFASNHGILTIATTNHPEKLDPALLHRPSRFDRKIEFGCPELGERRQFLSMANERLDPVLRLSPSEIEEVAASTDGFSFAYLQELSLAAMTSCFVGRHDCIVAATKEMAQLLRCQMQAANAAEGAS